MHRPRLFMFLTFIMVATTAGMIVSHLLRKQENPEHVPSLTASIAEDSESTNSTMDGSIESIGRYDSSPALISGMGLEAPEPSQLPVADDVPWLYSAAATAFRQADARACRVLEAGVDTIPRLNLPSPSSRVLGRIPAFSISLEVHPAARGTLPKVTKGSIEDYLHDNRLAIEVPLYADANGIPFLGSDLKAAAFERDNPSLTISPEPMVGHAVRDLRTIGVFRPKGEDVPLTSGTLVLIFGYSVENREMVTSVARAPKREFELIFLQLPKPEARESSKVLAFATSNQRTVLNELVPLSISDSQASINAQIRFREFTKLGLYPSDPIVIAVQHTAKNSLPVEMAHSLLTGANGSAPISLTDLLYEIHEGKHASAAVFEETSAVTPKHQPLESTFAPAGSAFDRQPASTEVSRPATPEPTTPAPDAGVAPTESNSDSPPPPPIPSEEPMGA
jgi:hypothetical protein